MDIKEIFCNYINTEKIFVYHIFKYIKSSTDTSRYFSASSNEVEKYIKYICGNKLLNLEINDKSIYIEAKDEIYGLDLKYTPYSKVANIMSDNLYNILRENVSVEGKEKFYRKEFNYRFFNKKQSYMYPDDGPSININGFASVVSQKGIVCTQLPKLSIFDSDDDDYEDYIILGETTYDYLDSRRYLFENEHTLEVEMGNTGMLCRLYSDNSIYIVYKKEGDLHTIYQNPSHVIPYKDDTFIRYNREFKGILEVDNTEYKVYKGYMNKSEFASLEYDGYGYLYQEKNLIYQGEFSEGSYHGYGTLYYENMRVKYQGKFSEGSYHGYGTLYYKNERVKYQGEFSEGSYHGYGTLCYEDRGVEYRGMFYEGLYSGEGTIYYENGYEKIKYQGRFSEGVYDGYGVSYNEDGSIDRNGMWYKGFFKYEYNGDMTIEEFCKKY